MSKHDKNTPNFRVTERIEDEGTGLIFYQVEFKNRMGQMKLCRISAGNFGHQDGFSELSKYDAAGSRDDYKLFCDKSLNLKQLKHVLEVNQTGWRGDVLISRHGVFGSDRPGEILLTDEVLNDLEAFEAHSASGTVRSFLEGFKPFAEKSDMLIVIYIIALWSTLGARIEHSVGHIVCLTGSGSTGKTSTLCLATSLSQKCIDDFQLLNFGDTEGIVLDRIPIMSGTINGFSDFKTDPKKNAGAFSKIHLMAFAATSGKLRKRKGEKKTKLVRPIYNVQLAFAMEISLAKAFLKSGIPLQDGERARLVEIKVPDRNEGGIFEGQRPKDAKSLAVSFKAFLAENFGTVTPAWVEFLQGKSVDELKQKVESLGNKPFHDVKSSDGLVSRIEDYFKNLQATLHMASQAGLLPVSVDQAEKALAKVFESNVESLVGDKQYERALRNKVYQTLTDRDIFPKVKVGEIPPLDLVFDLGFRRSSSNGIEVFVKRSEFVHHFAESERSFVANFLDKLAEKGFARPNKMGGHSHTIQQRGIDGKPRYMILDFAKLNARVKRKKPKKPKSSEKNK